MNFLKLRDPLTLWHCLLIVAMLAWFDFITKQWAHEALYGQPVQILLGGMVRMYYAENPGAFLSLLAGATMTVRFTVMVVFNGILMLGILGYLMWKPHASHWERFGFTLILAGGLGNLIDRVFLSGVVIDFLILQIGPIHTGIFNLADVYISVGTILLLWLWSWRGFGRTSAPGSPQVRAQIFSLLVLLIPPQTVIADTVIYEAGKHGGHIALNGQILEFNRKSLTIRVSSPDTLKELPAERILAIRVDRQSSYDRARESLNQGHISRAEEQFQQAFNEAQHPWMQREVLAGLIQSAYIKEDWLTAAEYYHQIVQAGPNSRHQDLIPLHWQIHPLSQEVRLWALAKLTSEDSHDRLIASSWLLSSEMHRQTAAKLLRTLLAHPRPDIRNLARCQLWRIELLEDEITDGDLQRWERQILDLPEEFRAGAMFVLGEGYERLIEKELAAARYLWLTTIDARNLPLTREATLRAARLLESLGQSSHAVQLRAEAELRFPQSGSSN